MEKAENKGEMDVKSGYRLSASGVYDLGKKAVSMGNEAPGDNEASEHFVEQSQIDRALRHAEILARCRPAKDVANHVVQSLSDIERRYPEIWERYRPLEQIGRGGQGLVIRAYDMESGKAVAIKIFDLSEAENWKSIELFEREVDVLKHLDIEGVPKYID